MTGAVADKGQGDAWTGGIRDDAQQPETERVAAAEDGRRQGRKQLWKGMEEGHNEDHASCCWLALLKRSQLALFSRSVPNALEPDARSREVFTFRPEELIRLVKLDKQVRTLLRAMPPLPAATAS
jgi:hypothetical protein